MSNQLTAAQDNEALALITSSKGVTASGKITTYASVMDLKFKAQNSYTVGKTTIKAVDVSASEAHFTGDKTEDELDRIAEGIDDNSAQLVWVSENSLTQLDNENPMDILEDVFNNSTKLETIKEEYQITLKKIEAVIEDGGTYSITREEFSINNGKIKIDSFSYKSFAADRQFRSFEQVQKQIELDNSLSIEDAEAMHNELYQNFPILSSTPIAINLNNKVVNQLDVLLSRTYSADHDAAIKVAKEVIGSYGKHYPVFNDVFAVINLGIAKGADYPIVPYLTHITIGKDPLEVFLAINLDGMAGSTIAIERNEPLKIIHSIDRTDLDKLDLAEAAGVYKPEYNVALFLETGERAVHEFTHAVMNIVFNNKGNPYSLENDHSYHTAVKDFLLNLNAKLGQNNEALLGSEIHEIYYHLQNSSILDLLAMAKTPSLDVKKFFSSKSIFSGEMQLDTWSLAKWQNKYFKDSITEEITNEQIITKLTEELEKLDLTPMEAEIISRVSNLFYHYEKDQLDGELIAKMVELYYEYGDEPVITEVFSPINQYWLDYIHPIVEQDLIIPHQLECNGIADTNIFVHCVEEFMA